MKKRVLVTGGNGFVGSQIVLALLKQGYCVNTTVRSEHKKQALLDTLAKEGVTETKGKLAFFEADLMSDTQWPEAMNGCHAVLSVASPVFFDEQKDEQAAIQPALEGPKRILSFAHASGIKRVVMTSNFGAVGFSQFNKQVETTEADWTNPDMPGLSLYEKSKVLAEKAAWDYVNSLNGELEFATINPVAILGVSINNHVSGSFMVIERLLEGKLKAIPNIPLNIVDVKDVVDLHIRAMVPP